MKQIILVSFFRSSLFDCRCVGAIRNRFIVHMVGCFGAVATRLFAIAFALSNTTGIARPQNRSLFSLHLEKDFGNDSTILLKHLIPIHCSSNISMFNLSNDYSGSGLRKHACSQNILFCFPCDVCL